MLVPIVRSKNQNNISYFELEGKSDDYRILIFLPGIGAYKENYLDHLQYFAGLYSKIYALDLPQQGSKGLWTIGNMIDNLKEFIRWIDGSKITEIHLGGHSAGSLAIISFLVNYNQSIEQIFAENSENKISRNIYSKLLSNGFTDSPPEADKVTKLFLYATPDSFNVVFSQKLSGKMKDWRKWTLKFCLDLVVNIPMKLLKIFTINTKTDFRFNGKSLVQFYGLLIENHREFLNYVSNYKTIFEIYWNVDHQFKALISNSIGERKVLIHYGSCDWLLKPWLKSRNIERNYQFNNNIQIVRWNKLGHILRNRKRLDINMNQQMITNRNIIERTKLLIDE